MRSIVRAITASSSPLRLAVGFTGLMVASAVIMALLTVISANTIDGLTRQRQTKAAENELAELAARIPRDQLSITAWDEAWQATWPSFDADWIDANIGRYMHTYFKHDDVLVVDPAGKVVYASIGNDRAPNRQELFAPFADARQRLQNELEDKTDLRSVSVAGFFNIGGRLAVASLAPIVPYDTNVPLSNPPYIHATIKYLDNALTEAASGREFTDVAATTLDHADPAITSIPLIGYDGKPVGLLQWRPDQPGTELMWKIGPVAGFVALLLLIASIRMSYALLRQSDELRQREMSFHMLFERSPVAMWIVDTETLKFVAVNDAACTLYEYSRERAIELNPSELRLPEERAHVEASIKSFGELYETETPVTRLTATGKHLRILAFGRRLIYQGRNCLVVANIDVTERERAASELASTRIFLDAIVESLPSMVFVKDANDGRFVLLNSAGEKLLGLKREELIGKSDFDLFSHDDAERFRQADREVVASKGLVTIENEPLSTPAGVRSLRTQKVGVPDAQGNPRYLLGISEDVTERLEVAQRNHHLSLHDILTDLPNRRSFQIALDEQLCGPQSCFALLLLDLDHFKAVNDSLGHHAGDELLRQLTLRLNRAKSATDFLARLGGDEFGVIHRSATVQSASELAVALLKVINEPFEIDGHRPEVGMSVGIVLSPDFGTTTDGLVKRCDLALYQAKAGGRAGYVFFEPAMEQAADTERLLREELSTALKKSQFEVAYQPIIDTVSGRIVCCEALLRWRHPELGLISPADFIPVAEASGLIEPIGQWVLEQACQEAAHWPEDVRIAVNLSAKQFTGFGLAATVIRTLEKSRLRPGRLELEITESVFLSASDETVRLLNELKQLGIRIALDDFGTGYSSLAYLRKFSFDKLKIDKSFISDLTSADQSLAIVRAIIGLGKSFSASVTAEGVETDEQFARLAEEGCEQCQGYLFSRPIPAEKIREMLEDFRYAQAS